VFISQKGFIKWFAFASAASVVYRQQRDSSTPWRWSRVTPAFHHSRYRCAEFGERFFGLLPASRNQRRRFE